MMHHHKAVALEDHGHVEMNQNHNWMYRFLTILLKRQMRRDEIVLAQEEIAFQNVLPKKEIVVHLECPVKPDQKVVFCVE